MKILATITFILFEMMMQAQQKATFGGGCFWCTEAIFTSLNGVSQVEPGYSGGDVANPTYKEVCAGQTGHAEVIHITFDPEIIAFEDLLEVFFATHDPTTLNRQGADVGTQYRSVVFYHNEDQKRVAEQAIRTLEDEKIFDRPVVTEVAPFNVFYPAENYHHDYFENNPNQPFCQVVIAPKVKKFKKLFKEKVK